jgi:hypothetical protein
MNRTTSGEGYTPDFVERREAAERQRAAEAAELRRSTADARRLDATLEAERETQKQRAWEALEADLAPTQLRLKRAWMAEHPTRVPRPLSGARGQGCGRTWSTTWRPNASRRRRLRCVPRAGTGSNPHTAQRT